MSSGPEVIAALAEVLIRRCLGRALPGDPGLAHGLARTLAGDEEDREVFAVGAVGAWAGFGPDGQLSQETITPVVDAARALLRLEMTVEERALVCGALGLLAARGVTNLPAVDFVNVATSARRIDQHELALWAARCALRQQETLIPSHQALALLTVAVITHEPDVVDRAYALAETLDTDDVARRAADALAPTLRQPTAITKVGESVQARNRRAAAQALTAEFEPLRQGGDALVSGLYEAFVAMAEDEVDVERARRALTTVVGHLRGRQRFGAIPSATRSGVDMVTDLLVLEPDPEAANVATELLEALADAGLSEVMAIPGEGMPSLVQARLAHLSQSAPIWPDLGACVAGLRGRSALLIRQQRSLSTGGPTFLAGFVTPPDSVAFKSVHLNQTDSATLHALVRSAPDTLASLEIDAVRELATRFLPRALIDRAESGEITSLVVVPDADAWTIPWQLAPVLAEVDVTLAPSLSMHARVPSESGLVESITAIVDEDAPSAEVVLDALLDVRARGFDVRLPRSLDAVAGGDLLVTFTHGGGAGLGFTAGSEQSPLPAIGLAATGFRRALIAACWSSAAPPVSYPLNLPAAMLVNGAATVIGGLWPLPAADTAAIVAAVVHDVGAGGSLRDAVRRARRHAPDTVLSRWGLAMHGGPVAP